MTITKRINSLAFQGIEVRAVDVQVQISNGLPAFNIVSYVKRIVLCILILFFCFYPEKSVQASSCYVDTPSNFDIITAPVIFTGKSIGIIDKQGQQYTRFEVIHMIKGPDVKTIDIHKGGGKMFGLTFGLGEEITLMPDVLKNGQLSLDLCSAGARDQIFWAGKARHAYEQPFPILYLFWDAYKYHFIFYIFILPSLLFLIFKAAWSFFRKKIMN